MLFAIIPSKLLNTLPAVGATVGVGATLNKKAFGGIINGQPNVELEGGEVTQGIDGSMAQINGPKHSKGGVQLMMEDGGRVFSDKIINPATGRTFADDAASLMRQMKNK